MTRDTYTVQRSETIHADPAMIYAQVVDYHRWPSWSPWEGMDPALERTYSGSASGVGSAYAWSGNRKAGEGTRVTWTLTGPTTVAEAG